ncbi:thiamine diphosphokinase [Bacillus sp. AK128]
MDIYIVAGGPTDLIPDLSLYDRDSVVWVGVDRGLYYLLKQGIVPEMGIGDFDSVTEDELLWMRERCVKFSISPAEKNQTDIELAIDWALAKNPKRIRLLGATGGRLDHSLATIQLLTKGLANQVLFEIIDQQNILTLLNPGTYEIHQDPCYSYISFLPFSSNVQGIHLSRDFKYPLTDCDISWGTSLCVSNELIKETGTFSFTYGIVIMVKSKD